MDRQILGFSDIPRLKGAIRKSNPARPVLTEYFPNNFKAE